MPAPPPSILPYAPPPNRIKSFFTRRTLIWLAILFLLFFLTYSVVSGPTSGQIRLDTGDLRYRWWGVPLYYRSMPEPARSKLVALSAVSPTIPARWVTCVTYPHSGTNNPDSMFQSFYYHVAIWADEDPGIARFGMEDVANWIEHKPHISLFPLLLTVDTTTKTVHPDWRDNEQMKQFCADHGYAPSPPAPATRK